jgi:gliding motility-associated-like protein
MSKLFKIYCVAVSLLLVQTTLLAQSNKCIETNNRLTYTLPLNGGLFACPISSTTNYITGGYRNLNDSGVILAKTYLDSVLWVKKYNSTERLANAANAVLLLDSSIITNSVSYGGDHLILIRFSKDGNLIWSKKYNLNFTNSTIIPGNQTNYRIKFYNNAIYISSIFQYTNSSSDTYNCIAKLDINGNIIWSKILKTISPVVGLIADPPIVSGDTVTIVANISYLNITTTFVPDSTAIVITKFNATNGNIISAAKIKTITNNYLKGIQVLNCHILPNKNLLLAGEIQLQSTVFPGGIYPSGNPFVLQIDSNNNFIEAKYFKPFGNTFLNPSPDFYCTFNELNQTGFLLQNINFINLFTLIIDSNFAIKSTKVFVPNPLPISVGVRTFNLENKGNSIFGISNNYTLNSTKLEYYRINNFLPTNSSSCVGKDTTLFSSNNFVTTTSTFVWAAEYSGLLNEQSFTLVSSPTTLSTQVICTQTSICDTIKINGFVNYCVTSPNATFTLYKNPQCLRKTDWIIDTAFIKIISQPNDTTINVKFLQPFHGYIKAGFEGCSLKDSLYIDVNMPKSSINLGVDTVFCPKSTVTLNAGTGFKSYLWQNNFTSSSFIATQPGVYYVTAKDSCNNSFTDSITLKPIDVTFDFLNFNPICLYDTVYFSLNPKLKNYTWLPTNSAAIENNYFKFYPENTTLFNITADRYIGCTLSDTLLIKVNKCPVYFYVPNSFTPNRDNLNDIIKPLISGKVEQYQFSIYNRYGQIVFKSSNNVDGWNGTFNGMLQETGVYIWTCNYKMKNQSANFKKGTILLLK